MELFGRQLQVIKFNGSTYILDGKKMWMYDGTTIKEVEFKPVIKECD